MGMVDPTFMDEAQRLNDADKVELAYALLHTVHQKPVDPETAALIKERVAHAESNPDDSILWEDLQADLRRKYA